MRTIETREDDGLKPEVTGVQAVAIGIRLCGQCVSYAGTCECVELADNRQPVYDPVAMGV